MSAAAASPVVSFVDSRPSSRSQINEGSATSTERGKNQSQRRRCARLASQSRCRPCVTGCPACARRNASIAVSRLSSTRRAQVAPQSCGDQIVMNGVLFQRRGIRNVRLVQTDALHCCHEFVADRIIFRRRLPGRWLRGQMRRGQKRRAEKSRAQMRRRRECNCGTPLRLELSRHARIMVLKMQAA